MAGAAVVELRRDGDVGVVELDRPPHNLLEGTMLDQIERCLGDAVAGGCRSVLLRSRLKHFSAGADLTAMTGDGLRRIDLFDFLHRVEDLPVPTVAAVHGAALGGGFELALACDLIVAAESAQLGLVESTLGLIPLMGGVPRLVARAGLARAKEMALLGRRHTPATLERWGVVNQVVPEASLYDAGLSLARQLAAGPTVAYRAIKEIANHTAANGTRAGDAMTVEVVPAVWESEDLWRGLQAFRSTGSPSAVFHGS